MTSLTAPTATAAASTGAAATPETNNPNAMLGQDDFLKLMVAQLQAQNPMQPSSDTEYLSELASFTELEQMTNLANAGELSGALQLIGHQVSYTDSKGLGHTGTVEAVKTTSSGTTLTVEGQSGVAESSVTEIV
jgi:flagellar basal-body rod modification protein FlgD